MTASVLISASPKNSKGIQIPDYENTTYWYCNSIIYIHLVPETLQLANIPSILEKNICRKYRAVSTFWTKAAETVKNRIIQDKAKHNKLGKSQHYFFLGGCHGLDLGMWRRTKDTSNTSPGQFQVPLASKLMSWSNSTRKLLFWHECKFPNS